MIWVRHCNIAVDNLCRLRNIQTRAAAVVATCHPRLNYNICNKFVSVPIPKGIPVAYRKMRILWYWREISYLMIWYRISSVPCNYPIVIQYVRRLIDPNLFADYKRDMDLRYRSHKIWITRAKMFTREKCSVFTISTIRYLSIMYSFAVPKSLTHWKYESNFLWILVGKHLIKMLLSYENLSIYMCVWDMQ